LGRKVSDEFTVPLCRAHHSELHQRVLSGLSEANAGAAAVLVDEHDASGLQGCLNFHARSAPATHRAIIRFKSFDGGERDTSCFRVALLDLHMTWQSHAHIAPRAMLRLDSPIGQMWRNDNTEMKSRD